MKIGAEFGTMLFCEKKVTFIYLELPKDSIPNGLEAFFEVNPRIMEITIPLEHNMYATYKRVP